MTQTAYSVLYIVGIFGLVIGAFALMPDASSYPVPPAFTDGLSTIVGYMKSLDFLLPFSTLVDVLQIAIAFHLAIFLWRRMWMLIRTARGSSISA